MGAGPAGAERSERGLFQRDHVAVVADDPAGAVRGAVVDRDRGAAGGDDAQLVAAEPVPDLNTGATKSRRNRIVVAAKRLRIGRTTAWGLVKNGELHSVQIGRLRRVPASAVDAYAARLLAGHGGDSGER